jgi:hypothetical protein
MGKAPPDLCYIRRLCYRFATSTDLDRYRAESLGSCILGVGTSRLPFVFLAAANV